MTRSATFAVVAAAALIAGCASSGIERGTTSTKAERTLAATSRGGPNRDVVDAGGPAVVRLSEAEFTITPANPRITGTHVVQFTVTNHGKVPHAIAVRGPFGVLKSERIAPGQQGGLTIDLMKPGIYTFYSPLGHDRRNGMQGSLVIESP
jgi:uncharacterized cupredoxin-like copper-binding protein